ncbi:acyltransferase family protein [Aquirufa regiilacus]
MDTKNRILSLDVFRGITVMMMTIVNNPGDWGHIYAPLEHAAWNGCTPTDLVFPFFLFIVGVSVSLNAGQIVPVSKIISRTLSLLLLGWFLSFFAKIHVGDWTGVSLLIVRLVATGLVAVIFFTDYARKLYVLFALFILAFVLAFGGFDDFANVRLPGVLPRIALVYAVLASLQGRLAARGLVFLSLLFLIGYWAIMNYVPVPGIGAANLHEGTNLAAYVDNYLLPGHLWSVTKTWDPEGILSTIPAFATGIMGMLAGLYFRSQTRLLAMAGLFCIVLGAVWDLYFPINKALWTSSFVLYTAGWAIVLLCLLYWLVDVQQFKAWTKPFVIFGVNPMLVFFFSGIIPRALNMVEIEGIGLSAFLQDFLFASRITDPYLASLAGALCYLLIWYVILQFFYQSGRVFKV